MDWTAILLTILSGTTLGGIVEAVRFRRENRRIKDAEAKNADTSAQTQQIDLGKKFIEDSLSIMQQVHEMQLKASRDSSANQEKMMQKLDTIDRRLDLQEIKIDSIERYLNGNYHQWLAEQGTKQTK